MQGWGEPELDAWDAWTPWEAAERFANVDVPWCVVGGWSIDLFVGEQTREHGDLEIEFLCRDFDVARAALAASACSLPAAEGFGRYNITRRRHRRTTRSGCSTCRPMYGAST